MNGLIRKNEESYSHWIGGVQEELCPASWLVSSFGIPLNYSLLVRVPQRQFRKGSGMTLLCESGMLGECSSLMAVAVLWRF